MLHLLELINNLFKKKKAIRKLNKVYNNFKIPFLLSIFGKNGYVEMEILRQYQLDQDIIKDFKGFAVFIIVEFNQNYKNNIRKIDCFKDLIRIEAGIEKYLFFCDNDVEELQRSISFFKKEVFEVKQGESYSFSIETFPPRSF